ncbi:hypothetical protein [Actinomadura sp. NAK00032]|nr:hypothetical protein [Actinomadura sp. NAK00032]
MYHDWSVNMAHEAPHGIVFLGRRYNVDRDDRVSLYGKPARQ